MLQSSKYYILQLLLDKEFWGNCVLPIKKSSLFHKYQGTILAFESDQQIYVCTGDLYKRGEFRPIEPRTWDFRLVDFCPMMGRDSQRGSKWGERLRGEILWAETKKNTPLIKKIDLSSAQGFLPRRRSPPIGGERLRGDFPRA